MGARAGSFLFALTRRWNRLTRRNWKGGALDGAARGAGMKGEVRSVRWELGHPGLPAGTHCPGAPGALHRRCPRRRGAASWPHPQLFPAERPQGHIAYEIAVQLDRHPRRLAPIHEEWRAGQLVEVSEPPQLSRWRNSAHTVLVARRHRHHAHAVDDRETATPGIFLGAALRRAHAGPMQLSSTSWRHSRRYM